MKTLTVITVTIVVAVLGWWLAAPSRTGVPPVISPAGILPAAPPTTRDYNPREVFEKAFWKRPTAEDRILNAERREWSDSKGIQQWQWFIAVQPSPQLLKHLRDENAFSLVPSSSPKSIDNAPDWFAFSAANTEAMHSPGGSMKFIFNKSTNTLYATDSGGGFRAGVPEPGKSFPQTAAAGRLPTTPPPKP